jgi:hypothetical protein
MGFMWDLSLKKREVWRLPSLNHKINDTSFTSTVLIYSTTSEAQSPPFPQSSDEKREKPSLLSSATI